MSANLPPHRYHRRPRISITLGRYLVIVARLSFKNNICVVPPSQFGHLQKEDQSRSDAENKDQSDLNRKCGHLTF